MLDENYIKQSAEKLLLNFNEEKNFFLKKSMDLYSDTIRQGRNLIRDVVSFSTIIAAFVIPLLLNANIILNKAVLFVSAICFIALILYGVLLLLFVVRKELNGILMTSNEMVTKTNESIKIIAKVVYEPTETNYFNMLDEIMKRHSDKKEKEEKLWNKFVNHDVGFYGLFVLALIFLIISIFYPIVLKLWFIQS